MTIALGVLGGRGIVLAADTEETIGDHKTDSLKVSTGFALGVECGAIAVTGAGYAPYLDCIFQRFEEFFTSDENRSIEDLGLGFQKILYGFYQRHVVPFNDSVNLDFAIIVGVQRKDQCGLWVSNRSALRRVIGHEAVGIGSVEANSVLLHSSGLFYDLDHLAATACYAVMRAKEKVVGCGKGTLLVCLSENAVHHVFPDVISELEKWFRRYEGIEKSLFVYLMGFEPGNEARYLNRMRKAQRELRTEFAKLVAQLGKDRRKE